MSCVFCRDVTKSGEVVFEDDATWVVLHDDWSVLGHAMIVAKRHVENLSDLTTGERARFCELWARVERVLLDMAGCERAVILKLGIATPHLHVHVYPVRGGASRDEVFAAIDGRVSVPRDAAFVDRVRARLGEVA